MCSLGVTTVSTVYFTTCGSGTSTMCSLSLLCCEEVPELCHPSRTRAAARMHVGADRSPARCAIATRVNERGWMLRTKGFDTESGMQQVLSKTTVSLSFTLLVSLSLSVSVSLSTTDAPDASSSQRMAARSRRGPMPPPRGAFCRSSPGASSNGGVEKRCYAHAKSAAHLCPGAKNQGASQARPGQLLVGDRTCSAPVVPDRSQLVKKRSSRREVPDHRPKHRALRTEPRMHSGKTVIPCTCPRRRAGVAARPRHGHAP